MKNSFYLISFFLFFVQAQPQLNTFTINGQARQYYLYTPDSLNLGVPLVIVLHGYSGSAVSIMNYTGMNQIADNNGFVVCYPQGLIDDWGNAFWNVGYDFHSNETVNDIEFLSALTQYLQMQYGLSNYNTFSTGMSNGGDMSYLLACQASEVFRAVAPVAGTMMAWIYDSCDPIRPIPVFEIHGTNDNVTYWEGDLNNVDGWGAYLDIPTIIDFWAGINNCTQTIIDTLPNMDPSDGSILITEMHID